MPRLVYKAFIDSDLTDNCYVVHKNKDRTNCRADNLTLGLEKRKFEGVLSQEQYKLFNNPVTMEYIRKKLCKHYNNNFENIKGGMTYDDLIQESLILIYKALFHYISLDDPIENSKSYRKYVYAIVEKFICKKYIRDCRTKRLEED